MKFTTAIAATVLLTLTSIAQAASIQNSATGLTGDFATETFSADAENHAAAGNKFSDLTFGAGNYITSDYSGRFPNIHGQVISNFTPPSYHSAAETSFTFALPVSGAAFNFVTDSRSSTFTAFLGDTQVETFSAVTNYDGNFYGFENISFDSIRINTQSTRPAYILDNLQTQAVPEPETYALMLAGLGALGFVARRRNSM